MKVIQFADYGNADMLHEADVPTRRAGARIVAGVRASQADEARALGADAVAVLGEDWTGAWLDRVIDTVGEPRVARLCRKLTPAGSIVTAATTPIDGDGLPAEPVFVIVHNDPARLAALAADVASGAIVMPIAHRLPLSQAHRLVERGVLGGKVVLEP